MKPQVYFNILSNSKNKEEFIKLLRKYRKPSFNYKKEDNQQHHLKYLK